MNTQIRMKNILILTLFALFGYQIAMTQEENSGLKGIQFFHGTFAEALAKAKKEDKLIFMDAFTTWCGPCRRMSSNVFPDEAVGEFYNANFINLKVDMEKGEGPELAQKYGVKSYPTLLYIGAESKVVHNASGARPADAFIELGREALKKFDKSGSWEKLYNEGKRDAATVLSYIKSLNQVGKPSLRIANEYLSSQTDLTKPENLEIILESATEADSRIFDYLIKNKEAIIKLKTKAIYESKVYNACTKTIKKAMEYRNESLLIEAQEKMKNNPDKFDEFKYTTDMDYYGATGDANKFLTAAKGYSSKIAKNNAIKHKDLSQLCLKNFKEDKKIMEIGEKSAKKALELLEQQDHYINFGRILYHNGKKTEAIAIIKKGIEAAKLKGEPTQMLDYMLRDWGEKI
ncbi:MAG: thioredoxin family protein [Saprospiraceae bacterium]|nr:thioredoxin family protein [Saprospiraceae bacterium]MBK9729566.1 thioredoxin family protein [Saprospiraceae bacterium]